MDHFQSSLFSYLQSFRHSLETDEGEWVVKGFIDVYRNVYTISLDTKVVSKIIELMLFPLLARYAQEHRYRLLLSEHQNHYPDVSFVALDDERVKIALDVKSAYRYDERKVSGFTLGSFTGYFRDRESTKNTMFPYSDYSAHYVIGVIYSRSPDASDEGRVHRLEELSDIVSVVHNFQFLLQDKWRIASDKPGSGNTKNIGSVNDIATLIDGDGPFSPLGEAVFDDYWRNYLTNDMAIAIDSPVPYRNLRKCFAWRHRV
jgi:hypothetical protein